ncbi:MAG: DUF255 domain-containing protein [Gammaproteobacteria bacterium]|nr:DUF255 domain-containing protein [Gammaproteobacteria bacterium]
MKYSSCFLLTLILTSTLPAFADEIFWQQWGVAAFHQARDENKMILLDVGMEGCTACRWMDEITYTDTEVINLVNQHFVAIVADAEAQPDIGERYSDWAWPATIFMAPDTTQVLALAGNRRPKSFVPILNELIEKKASNQLEADKLAPYAAAPAAETSALSLIRDRVRGQVDSLLNEQYGGWTRSGVSTATGARVEHLFMRAHMYSNAELLSLALKTSDAYLKAIDPVWGGVFVKTFHGNSQAPERFKTLGSVPEKRLSNQANALTIFAHAYRTTRDQVYLDGIREIDRFMRLWFRHENGTFYTSQEDDPPGLKSNMDAIDYWLLDSDEKRRVYGTPPIDHAVYTDKNAQAIMAYVQVYLATNEISYLQTARRSANTLMAERLQTDGWLLQTVVSKKASLDERMRPLVVQAKPTLAAQAWFGSALLSLYEATGDSRWLSKAIKLADAMLTTLYDNRSGGFFARPPDELTALIPQRLPLELNARAAHFFYDLWIHSKNEKYSTIPEGILRAVAIDNILSREGKIVGQTALALEKLTAAYVEFSVVGETGQSDTMALFEAGKRTYHPRKLLHFEKIGRYPHRNKAAMYICNPDRCSIPIEDPTLVVKQADNFRLPASFSP